MANVIKHKRGTSDPSPSDLVVGEIGIRTDVGKLFTKTDSGTVSEIAGGGSDIIINTLSSSSATGGGSATFNGSAYRFTLSQPPSVSAQQLLVSIAGVIQKPVAGSSQPSEGFSVSGNDIILASAPATGTDFFILTFKSLGVSEPADNTVTSAKIVDGTIVGTDLATNIDLVDSQKIRLGNSQDLQIYHDGLDSYIRDMGTGELWIDTLNGNSVNIISDGSLANGKMARFFRNGAVELYYDNAKKLETDTNGITVTGNVDASSYSFLLNDSGKLEIGASSDLKIYHDGSNSHIKNTTAFPLLIHNENDLVKITGNNRVEIFDNLIRLRTRDASETYFVATANGSVELYHDNAKKFETNSIGVDITGITTDDGARHDGDVYFIGATSGRNAVWDMSDNALEFADNAKAVFGTSADLQIYHDGTDSHIYHSTAYPYNDLLIRAQADIKIQTNNTENAVVCNVNGSVELYHDNVKKLETLSNGVNATGNFNVTDGQLTITHSVPALNLYDNSDPNGNDYAIQVNTNLFKIVDLTNSSRLGFQFGSDGNTQLGGNVTFTGNILVNTDSTHSIGSNTKRFANGYFDTLYGDGSNLTGISGTTISGNADNRIITGSGTANTLEGESTLLYDSTTLTLSKGGLTNGQKLIIRGSGNSTGDDLTINNWGNSDGDYWTIGVNLTANSGGSTAKTNTALRHSGVILDGRMGRVIFSASETSTATKSDSHTFERDGSIKMKGSLYLDGETSSSHALDSYEEGSWTPTAHSGGSGVATIYAKYTKTGRVVHVLFRGYLTGLNGNSVQIGGLPYANLNNTNNVAAVMHNGFDYSGSTEPVAVSYISGQNSYFVLYFSQTNSNGWTSVSGNNTNGAQFITSLKYFTS